MKNRGISRPESAARRERFRAIWTFGFLEMFLVATVISFSVQFQATAFPIYVRHLGGSLTAAGLMTSVYMGASALCKPFVGKLLDRFPRKRLFVITGLCFTGMLFTFGFVRSIPMLIVMRMINAPFYSVCYTSATTMATDMLPDDGLIEGLGYYNLAQTLSYALGPGIALTLINGYSYRTLFTACSVSALCAVLIGLTVKYKDPVTKGPRPAGEDDAERAPREEVPEDGGRALRAGVLIPALTLFMVLLGTSGIVTYLPTWAETVGVENIGVFFTVQAVSLAAGRFLVGRVSKRIGVSATLFLSILMVTGCLFGITFCATLTPLLVLSLIYGFGFGALVPTLHSIAILSSPKSRRGMTNSIIQMANDAGICVCSITLGVLADAFGIRYVFLISAVFPALSLAVYAAKLRGQIKELGI